MTYSRVRTGHCLLHMNKDTAPTELGKKKKKKEEARSDFDETTSFGARGLALVQCSAAWLEFAWPLLSSARGSRGQRGLETF